MSPIIDGLTKQGATGTTNIPEWKTPPVTQHELEWADILTVDLSTFQSEKNQLVRTVETALHRDGFFYVVGHGIDKEKVNLIISDEFMPPLILIFLRFFQS